MEHDDGISPRVHDFATPQAENAETSKSPSRKRSKKYRKKHNRKRQHRDEEKQAVFDEKTAIKGNQTNTEEGQQPTVGWADDVEVAPIAESDQSAGKRAFNIRQLSSRPAFRPALPKMLSNTVFTAPPPNGPTPVPTPPVRTRSSGLRRTSSLPDRLNRQATPTGSTALASRDPLPPYQHQRPVARAISEIDNDDEADDEKPIMSRTAATVLLLVSTALVAVCAEFLVDAIPAMVDSSPVSQAFIGLIILPIVGNAAEHVTAVTVATKNKMDLAIGVAVGSSIQIALFVTPFVVILGWILGRDMSLYFNLFETVSLFATAFVVNFLVLDGRSNYLEGSLLIAAYVIIA